MTFVRAAAGRNIKIAAERGNKIAWRKGLERVLDGATVIYGSAAELQATLDYDFSQEKKFSYKGLSMDEIIHHLAVFVSGLWQTHVFGEGNTRATAVFFIKYLRTLGFDVTNDIFAEHAWYFRNSLVRANYNDLKNGIHETTEYLEVFFRNLLLNENHPLHNRALHIKWKIYFTMEFRYNDRRIQMEQSRMLLRIGLRFYGAGKDFKAVMVWHE